MKEGREGGGGTGEGGREGGGGREGRRGEGSEERREGIALKQLTNYGTYSTQSIWGSLHPLPSESLPSSSPPSPPYPPTLH